jgi:hypothetical protein
MLAGCATLAAWYRKRLALSVATAVLLLFCLLAGFSIGLVYMPGGGLILAALTVLLVSESETK